MKSQPLVPWIALFVTLAGLLTSAAVEWGALRQRVTTIERMQEYLHGRIEVPGGVE